MVERQKSLLKEIVETYIQTFKPVSSNSLTNKFKVSPATIRNDMALLEDLGYIEKKHTSSGRIPSESGYKYYVNNLMEPKDITGEDVLKLQTILSNNNLVVSDAINKCMEIISEITHYTSVVIDSHNSKSTLKNISITPIENNDDESSNSVVVVLVTNTGHVENKQINISKDINIPELIKTSEIINQYLVDTPLSEVNERLEFEIKPKIKDMVLKYEQIVGFFREAFDDFSNSKNDVFFGGKTNILDLPEYNEADKIKDLVSKMENIDLVKHIDTNESGINIYIGEENEFDPDVTIIKTHYQSGAHEGTLAIIGPKRMEYNKVVTLLNFLKSYIEK